MIIKNKIFKDENGFSLIEVMIAVLLFLALFNAIWSLYSKSVRSSNILSDDMSTQQEIRRSFTSMTAGIRSAATSNIGSYPIAAASSTGLIYYSDIDKDGVRE